MSKDGMLKDGRKMSAMHVTLKAGVMTLMSVLLTLLIFFTSPDSKNLSTCIKLSGLDTYFNNFVTCK